MLYVHRLGSLLDNLALLVFGVQNGGKELTYLLFIEMVESALIDIFLLDLHEIVGLFSLLQLGTNILQVRVLPIKNRSNRVPVLYLSEYVFELLNSCFHLHGQLWLLSPILVHKERTQLFIFQLYFLPLLRELLVVEVKIPVLILNLASLVLD